MEIRTLNNSLLIVFLKTLILQPITAKSSKKEQDV